MFRQLDGNPLSIRRLAALHANEMLRNNDLKSIYGKVKDEVIQLDDENQSMLSRPGHGKVPE